MQHSSLSAQDANVVLKPKCVGSYVCHVQDNLESSIACLVPSRHGPDGSRATDGKLICTGSEAGRHAGRPAGTQPT